jgi:hypothetical protein
MKYSHHTNLLQVLKNNILHQALYSATANLKPSFQTWQQDVITMTDKLYVENLRSVLAFIHSFLHESFSFQKSCVILLLTFFRFFVSNILNLDNFHLIDRVQKLLQVTETVQTDLVLHETQGQQFNRNFILLL